MGNSDSSTLFRDCVNKLLNQEVLSEDHDFWTLVLSVDFSAFDLVNSFPFTDVHKLKNERHTNFIRLLELCLKTLGSPCGDASSVQAISNAVKILTRLMPASLQDEELLSFWWGENPRAVYLLKNILALMFTPIYAVSNTCLLYTSDAADE